MKTTSVNEVRRVCESAGTSIDYFRQIANGHRHASRKLALRLEQASDGKLVAEALVFPERHQASLDEEVAA